MTGRTAIVIGAFIALCTAWMVCGFLMGTPIKEWVCGNDMLPSDAASSNSETTSEQPHFAPGDCSTILSVPTMTDKSLLLAVALRETRCRHWKDGNIISGDGGRSIGLFQIGPFWHAACGGKEAVQDLTTNIHCADWILANLIAMYGLRDGVRRYNGSGAMAERYADEILQEYQKENGR